MENIFNPQSVALIGATDRRGSVGFGIAKNLLFGKSQRKIFFVNPSKKKILNQKTVASILDIKQKIDLAVIAVPSRFVKGVILECVQANVGSCIIISSGFAELSKEGAILQKEIAELLRENNIPLVGPNCLGVINPTAKLNASFAPETPKPGAIAFLSQSGALIDSIIDKSLLENFGFSLVVSYGNEAGLCLNDFLKIASVDENTKVIAIYLEEIKNGQEFIKIASEVTKRKPITILKGGKTKIGKKAVQSHTASLAGDEKIYSAAFKKANIIEVETIEDLFLTSQVLSIYSKNKNGWPLSNAPHSDADWLAQTPAGNEAGWAILTNGGAVGVITADWCSRFCVKMANIPKAVFEEIEQSKKINLSFTRNNPLDIIGDASSEGYSVALRALLKQEKIKGVIFCQTLQTMTNPIENAKIIIEAQNQFKDKPILALFLGGKITQKGVEFLKKNQCVVFTEPRDIALMASIVSNF
ncbi:MAG: CoA-binding protein [Candidatus Pacebacteria bacterium]|nr:CoA-binding protein [Candidatus Paceibacterota bacterium]